jgi:hypothetical protein
MISYCLIGGIVLTALSLMVLPYMFSILWRNRASANLSRLISRAGGKPKMLLARYNHIAKQGLAVSSLALVAGLILIWLYFR